MFDYVNQHDVPFTRDDSAGFHELPFGNPIEHFEYPERRESKSQTLEGHIFHDGRVTHRVHFEDGYLYYDVVGEGSGPYPYWNVFVGGQVFRPNVQEVVRRYGAPPAIRLPRGDRGVPPYYVSGP